MTWVRAGAVALLVGAFCLTFLVDPWQHELVSNVPLYNAYATDVLMPAMDQEVLAEIKRLEAAGATDDPRYEQLLMEHHYLLHVLRIPLEDLRVRRIGKARAIRTRRSPSDR